MTSLKFPHCMSTLCAALMLAACGGEGGGDPATAFAMSGSPDISCTSDLCVTPAPSSEPGTLSPSDTDGTSSESLTPGAPDTPAPSAGMPEIPPSDLADALDTPGQSPRTMAGFPNVGGTCYANSALKFLIHSVEPQRLIKHLIAESAASDTLHRDAAMQFVKLIESSYSEAGPTQAELQDFFASLQQLPAFSERDTAGALNFPLIGAGQTVDEFLLKLSESFALDKLYDASLTLIDELNAYKFTAAYWTTLRPLTAQDSLQDLFDRTSADGWQVLVNQELRHLAIAIDDNQNLFGNRNFDFNQTVRLEVTDATSNARTVLTLEPSEVIEFKGSTAGGHYLLYTKDEQWLQQDDQQVRALDRMPAIDHVRMINFSIVKREPGS